MTHHRYHILFITIAIIVMTFFSSSIHATTTAAASAIPIAKMRDTKSGDTFHNWKHCYGSLLVQDEEIGGFHMQHAYLTYVEDDTYYHGQLPGVQFSAVFARKEWEKVKKDGLMYKLELWHEQTGARIRYRGNWTDLQVSAVVAIDEKKSEKSEKSEEVKLQIVKPLHVEDNGKYEATFVLFYYRDVPGTSPPRREMDERLCTDVRFTFQKTTTTAVKHEKRQQPVAEENKPLSSSASVMAVETPTSN